ncbi:MULTISPECIES: FitA-like ribbon-helix-helix domain-containing protein [Brevibacterium]|jgi:plasmid stability protein|uniref:Antitoxin FitA-like ribbon-helix-helix domain-containing protein n=1 Tax=Brevibacterium salitolerans TaxID=1403566 RepID=A0ABP5HTW6_9MICO|nr:hypothetical protein [Brevibacterium sp.]
MATLTIRGLPEETRRALKRMAAEHNRSMEAEARTILEAAAAPRVDFIAEWLRGAVEVRGEFELPTRSAPRDISLS